MRCPKCGYRDTRIIRKSKWEPKRERRCIACGERFPTLEVIKGDGQILMWHDEEYNRIRLEREMERLGVKLKGEDNDLS